MSWLTAEIGEEMEWRDPTDPRDAQETREVSLFIGPAILTNKQIRQRVGIEPITQIGWNRLNHLPSVSVKLPSFVCSKNKNDLSGRSESLVKDLLVMRLGGPQPFFCRNVEVHLEEAPKHKRTSKERSTSP